MKLDSPLFDCIRVKPGEDRRLRAELPCCNWPNCTQSATHRAPKGRNREREYWRFCLDHVREYHQSYNFFAGMSDDAVARFASDDPFDIWQEFAGPRAGAAQSRAQAERRTLRNAERKALHALGLEDGAAGTEIKARFKELVKRHHPDANGGDRASEDKLREIIESYNYLKKTGFC